MNNTDNIDNTTDNTADKAPEPKEKEHFSPVASFYDLASVLASAFVLLTIIFTFVFRVVGVIGQSMENTVFENDWLITVQKEEYEYGDIVISTQPNYFNEPLIKRVIATGGQTVDIDYSTSTVYVDGVALFNLTAKRPDNYLITVMERRIHGRTVDGKDPEDDQKYYGYHYERIFNGIRKIIQIKSLTPGILFRGIRRFCISFISDCVSFFLTHSESLHFRPLRSRGLSPKK